MVVIVLFTFYNIKIVIQLISKNNHFNMQINLKKVDETLENYEIVESTIVHVVGFYYIVYSLYC